MREWNWKETVGLIGATAASLAVLAFIVMVINAMGVTTVCGEALIRHEEALVRCEARCGVER